MNLFALIVAGRVAEVVAESVSIDGVDVPLSARYHPDFVAALVPYDPENPPVDTEPVGATVPASVSRFQARAALYLAGYFEAVEEHMARPDTPMLSKLAWQDAQTFERSSATVAVLAAALALSDSDVDALFTSAAEITA